MKINCPHCRKEYEIDSSFEFWHQEVTCAECGKDFVAMTDQERAVEEKKRRERSAAKLKRIRNIILAVIAALLIINGTIVAIGFFENRTAAVPENSADNADANASESSENNKENASGKSGNSEENTSENSKDNAENSGDNTENASENSDSEASE